MEKHDFDIEKIVDQLNIDDKPRGNHKDRLRWDVLKAFNSSSNTTKDVKYKWRIIMKSKITKFAAAAVILIAVLIGINQFGGSIDGTTVAWAEVVEHIKEFRPYICNYTVQKEGGPARSRKVYKLSLSRRREERDDGDIYIFDMSGEDVLFLMISPKRNLAFVRTYLGGGPRKDPDLLRILSGREQRGVEDLGTEEIDGRLARVFHSPDEYNDFTVWADVKTGLPIRIELLHVQKDQTITMEDFQFDVDLDESLFDTTPPEGYDVETEEVESKLVKKPKELTFASVIELFYSARNIHMKATMYFPEGGEDADSAVIEVEHWLDIENGRWRSTKPNTYSGPEGFKFSLAEEIFDGGDFELNIDHSEKQASFTRISKLQKNLRCRRYAETVMTFVYGDPQLYDLYENIGTEVIDGLTYNIWEMVVTHPRMSDMKMQSWLSPETGDFAKAIVWLKGSDSDWAKKFEITTMEQNVIMPDELFVIEAPDGYKMTNTRQTAYEGKFAALTGGWNSFVLEKYLMFALSDGSVIMCWASRDKDSDQSQAPLFAELQFGGDFPKLPNEVYALETNLKGQKMMLQGRHLCYTQQNEKFYEWGLYVPKEELSQPEARVLACTLVFRNHSGAKTNARLGSTPDLLIRNSHDFNKFVLGAMAEFSDDRSAPYDITYENILDLIEDIRLELEQ